jgi:hypothetical protein
MSNIKGPKTRRAFITLEFYNISSLDTALSKLRKQLIEGIESNNEGYTFNKRDLLFEFKQTYPDNLNREKFDALLQGQKVELVRSSI